MNDNQILVVHSRGVYYFMGMIWWHSFHFSVTMHSFQKLFQILAKCSSYVNFETVIEFAWVYDNKAHTFLIWDICEILQSMEGISIGNEKMSAFPHY